MEVKKIKILYFSSRSVPFLLGLLLFSRQCIFLLPPYIFLAYHTHTIHLQQGSQKGSQPVLLILWWTLMCTPLLTLSNTEEEKCSVPVFSSFLLLCVWSFGTSCTVRNILLKSIFIAFSSTATMLTILCINCTRQVPHTWF